MKKVCRIKLSGRVAAYLHDTHGVPKEISHKIAEEKGHTTCKGCENESICKQEK